MKEKIVIEKELLEKIIKASPIQWFDNKEKTENLVLFGKEYKTEKYPTNWEDLKELCKGIKGNKKDCGGAMWFEFGCLNNDKMYLGKFLCVDEKGQVGIAERSWGEDISITIFAQNRTSQQMWQIIKNLIGED